MPSGGGNTLNQKLTDFFAQLRQIVVCQKFHIARRLNTLQKRIIHFSAPRSSFNIYTIGMANPSTTPRTAPVRTSMGGMSDHLLEFFSSQKRKGSRSLIHPLAEHAIQQFCLLAGFIPHTHGIIHDNDGQHSRNGKLG